MRTFFQAVFFEDYNELKSELLFATTDITRLKFNTVVPGGYEECSFQIKTGVKSQADLYRLLIGRHLVIFDWWGERVYEGRVEDTEIDGDKLGVVAVGYYSNMRDTTAGPSVFISTKTAYDILKFMIDLAPDIQDEYEFMAADDLVQIGPKEYERSDKIADAIKDVLQYGYLDTLPDTSTRRRGLYFAVWNNRFAYTFPEPDIRTDEPDWLISIHDLEARGGFTQKTSTKGVYNKIYVGYNDPNLEGTTYMSPKSDLESQDLYGVREGVINIGEATLNVATVVQNLAVEYSADPSSKANFSLVGDPRKPGGMLMPLHRIRAGEMIQLLDHDPATAKILGGQQGKAGSVLFVAETKFNAETNTMRLVLGSSIDILETLLTRLGVGGSVD